MDVAEPGGRQLAQNKTVLGVFSCFELIFDVFLGIVDKDMVSGNGSLARAFLYQARLAYMQTAYLFWSDESCRHR